MPLASYMIYPHTPLSRPMPHNPVSCPQWVQLQESPPSTPNTPNKPESSADPWIDSTAITKNLSILQGLLSGLPMSLWSTVPVMTDTDRHWCPNQWYSQYTFHLDLTAPTNSLASHTLLRSSFHLLIPSYICLPCSPALQAPFCI